MIKTTATALSAALAFSSLSLAQSPFGSSGSNASSSACPAQGGAHIIVARASLEPPGYGIIGVVKDQVLQQVPGSTAEFVTYPATLDDYTNSESDGVIAMRKLINTYISKCNTNLPLVVMGYSQGAQVTADSLVGQQVAGFQPNASIQQPLAASTLSRVAAVVMMGDPSFTTTESFHVGNASKNAIFPRTDVSNFNIAGLASRTKSYCDFNDPYCASGNFSNGLGVHIGYVGEYGTQASSFVVSQIKAFYSNGTSTSTNGTSSTGSGSSSGASSISSSGSSTGAGSGTGTGSSSGSSGSSSTSATPAAYTGAASILGASAGLEIMSAALLAGLLAWML